MTDALDIQFNKRFSKNVISNIFYFIINVIIGLALVPFFIDSLGPAAYGLIPLATSITSYITIVIDAINGAISRFLTIDLQRADDEKANQTFNTALFGTLGVILCLTPVAIFVAWLAPQYFNIGNESAIDVFLLFALIFGSVLIRTWSSNFMVTLFALNRLDLRNYVNITNIFTQCIAIVILFILFGPSLIFVGASYFLAAILQLILSVYFSRKICPDISVSPSKFSGKAFKEIGGMSFWILTDSVGVLLRYQIALMIVNILFGEVMGTEYALALTWFTLLISIAALISNVFTPMIYSYYAKGEPENLIRFSSFAAKSMGIFMALPIALVCIFTPQLMTIWVGPEFAHISLLVWIIVAPCLVKIQAGCISPIYGAYNKVKIPALVNIVIGVITPILALTLPYVCGLGVYGIAIACSFSIIFIAVVMIPLYTAYIMKKPWTTYYNAILPGVLCLFLLFASGYIVANWMYSFMDSFVVMFVLGITMIVCYVGIILWKLFSKTEKMMIRSCLPTYLTRYIPEWLL